MSNNFRSVGCADGQSGQFVTNQKKAKVVNSKNFSSKMLVYVSSRAFYGKGADDQKNCF